MAAQDLEPVLMTINLQNLEHYLKHIMVLHMKQVFRAKMMQEFENYLKTMLTQNLDQA